MKCIVIDDEPFALELTTGYVEKTPFLNLQGAFTNPFKALDFLTKEKTDLVFIDINMPELSGLQLISSLPHPPMIVFTTAYSEYGAESYNYDAVDYLLKPINYARFLRAVTKASEIFNRKDGIPNVTKKPKTDPEPLLIKSGTQIHKIRPEEILFVEGAGNYAVFHTTEKKIMALMTIKNLVHVLPEKQFAQVHKSYIVSLNHIDVIEKHQIKIKGKLVPIGRTYREIFMRKIASGN